MKENSQEKILVERIIWQAQKHTPFKWKDIKNLTLQDEDEIRLEYHESQHISEDEFCPEGFDGTVSRMELETEEEFQKRQADLEQERVWGKARRRENYLRLKKEFEDEK